MADIFLMGHHFVYDDNDIHIRLGVCYHCKICYSKVYMKKNGTMNCFFDKKGIPYNRNNETMISCNDIIIKSIIE